MLTGCVRWSLALWVVTMVISGVMAGLERHCSPEDRRKPRGICGRSLADTLHLLCQGIYHKRSSGMDLVPSPPELTDDKSVFMSKTDALSYLQHKRSYSHPLDVGIVCECCVHVCTPRELYQYCASDTGLFGKRSYPAGFPVKTALKATPGRLFGHNRNSDMGRKPNKVGGKYPTWHANGFEGKDALSHGDAERLFGDDSTEHGGHVESFPNRHRVPHIHYKLEPSRDE
nr:IRP-2 [Urechis unicinctus]